MLGKLLVLLLAVAAAWYGYRLLAGYIGPRLAKDAGKGGTPRIAETVRCVACGSYLARGHESACGRDDCPY